MISLGIESSCDETSVAIVRDGKEILANVVHSQLAHIKFGGVVPEVASREHIKLVIPVYQQALERAEVTLEDIDLISATVGPGLVGPLLVGLSFAKGLAWASHKPFVPVNHLEGHLAANLLEHGDLAPHHLTLIVSGGHTLLVEVIEFGEYRILGRTRDDAAGEAFDKVAKLLGLGYPGGAQIDRLAAQGDPKFHRFPRAVPKDETSFSFSGLKTAVSLYIRDKEESFVKDHLPDIAASFQEAVVDALVNKTIRMADSAGIGDVTISGGVAANSRLRDRLSEELKKRNKRLFYPSIALCTDNGAMIAAAGYYKYQKHGPGELIANAVPYLPLPEVEH